MTRSEIVGGLEQLEIDLRRLVVEDEAADKAHHEAQSRLDDLDAEMWHGKASGQLRVAIAEAKVAEHEYGRSQGALAANHRRRRELETLLQQAEAQPRWPCEGWDRVPARLKGGR